MTGTIVLVVDDEPSVREVVVGSLRRDGHEVAEAADGDVAPTTTTTTTTTTTLPPTTTTISGLLPETGSDAGRTSTLMLLAIGFLIAGGSLIAVRRR